MPQRQEVPPAPVPRGLYGWYAVATGWLMLFLISAVSVGIFFKPILEEFGWDRATLSLVHAAAPLLFALAWPFLGRFIDRFGPRAMLLLVVGSQATSSALTGLAGGLGQIYAGRILYELRALQAAQVLVNRWFVRLRGRAQGILASGLPLGTLVLSPLSAYLIIGWGWRPTMLFWGGLTFVLLLPLTFFLRDNPADKGLLPDGDAFDAAAPAPAMAAPGSSLAEAARSRSFWLLSSSHFICGIGCGFMMTHIVIFATDVGYSEMVGASFLSVQGGVNLVGVLLTGHLSDRRSRSRVLALTHVIRSLSFATVVVFFLAGGASLWLLYAAMALFGFGWFTTSPLASGLVADLFGNRRMGTIIGLALSSHTVGAALGAYGGGLTFVLTGSYYLFFLIQAGLELLAAGLAFAIKPGTPAPPCH